MNCEEHVRDLYDYALQKGFRKEQFISADNAREFIDTTVDAYDGYPLFQYVFPKKYDRNLFACMIDADFKTRFHTLAGIASSPNFESVLVAEPPLVKKPGMLQYLKQVGIKGVGLFLHSAVFRQDNFENYAAAKRRSYMDEKTWYVYIFATKKQCQRKGYGKKVMNLICSYADEKKARLCLETNLEDNVVMYEHFGFRMVDSGCYRNNVKHFVFLKEPDVSLKGE